MVFLIIVGFFVLGMSFWRLPLRDFSLLLLAMGAIFSTVGLFKFLIDGPLLTLLIGTGYLLPGAVIFWRTRKVSTSPVGSVLPEPSLGQASGSRPVTFDESSSDVHSRYKSESPNNELREEKPSSERCSKTRGGFRVFCIALISLSVVFAPMWRERESASVAAGVPSIIDEEQLVWFTPVFGAYHIIPALWILVISLCAVFVLVLRHLFEKRGFRAKLASYISIGTFALSLFIPVHHPSTFGDNRYLQFERASGEFVDPSFTNVMNAIFGNAPSDSVIQLTWGTLLGGLVSPLVMAVWTFGLFGGILFGILSARNENDNDGNRVGLFSIKF